jgi:hypothetical protein
VAVLRLHDARTGVVREVVPARPGVLSVRAGGRTPRDAVVVDVVRRLVELDGHRLLLDGETPYDAVLAPAGPVVAPAGDVTADPLVTRLATLAVPYREPLVLSPDSVAAAGARLGRWRAWVSAWAEQPSRRMPQPYVDAVLDAWADDLDAPGVLTLLDRVTDDPEVAEGARFETFVWADRVLALELARDVGR